MTDQSMASDGRRIGIMYLVGIGVTFLLGFTLALLLRTELLSPGQTVLDPSIFARVVSVHGVLMVFLCALPAIPAILGNFVLPSLLRTSELAFPRLNRLSLWLYLVGVALSIVFVVGGGVGTGWTLLPPLATQGGWPVAVLAVGLHLVGLSLVFTGFNLAATVMLRRPAEMPLAEMPVFAWSLLAYGVLQVLVAPLLSSLALMFVSDQLTGGALFDPAAGGDPQHYRQLFWFFSHAAFQLTLIPVIGVVSEVLADLSRKRVHAYSALVWSILAVALLAPAAWGIHLVTGGEQSPATSVVFSALFLIAAIPWTVVFFSWLGTLYEGSILLKTPLLYALAAMVHLAVGGLGGLFLGALSTRLHLEGTWFASAQMHYLMAGAWGAALLAGLYHWWPKLTGRLYDEKWAALGAGLGFAGFNLSFLTSFLVGGRGVLAGSFRYPVELAGLQRLSGVGAAVLAIGLFVVLVNLVVSLLSGDPAPADPRVSGGDA